MVYLTILLLSLIAKFKKLQENEELKLNLGNMLGICLELHQI